MNSSTSVRTALLVLLGAAFLSGCSDSVENLEADDAGKNSKSPPKVSLMVSFIVGSGDGERTDSMDFTKDPSPAEIEKRIRALDWDNRQRRPLVSLGRTEGAIRSFSVASVLDADGGAQQRAKWLGLENDKASLRQSSPLTTVDEIVALMLAAYRQDQDKLAALAEWDVVESD
jgi:hypothetical protein